MIAVGEDGLAEPGSSWSDGPSLTASQFARLAAFIEKHFGIRMPPAKKVLLERRLHRRLTALGLDDFGTYCARVLGGDEQEIVLMVDAVTTNKTDFFREPQHFEFLANTAVPALIAATPRGASAEVRAWSAACSSGEEPYTLAMVLAELEEGNPGLRWRIEATDISTQILRQARNATYRAISVDPVPMALRQKYLLRRSDGSPEVRIGPELRQRVHFGRLNLLDASYRWPEPFEVIFCRNALIYFERAVQEAIVQRLARALAPGGYLFLGHSESIHGMDVHLEQEQPTVYRKPTVGR
jgi:chemotaxis protein methyltransferase CheR